MRVKDIIKKQTTMVAIAVIMIVVAAIGVSYAIFFDVKGNTNNQVITAGTLSLTVTDASSAFETLEVSTDEVGLKSTAYTYSIKNNGNLPSSYKVYAYAGSSNALALSNISVSLDGGSSGNGTSKLLTGLTSSQCTIDGTTYTCYLVESGTLAAGASSATKYIRMWLREDIVNSEVDANLNLNLHITSEVNE